MANVKEAAPPPLTVLPFCLAYGEQSVKKAIWRSKLARIKARFEGGTTEEDEDAALAILMSAEGADELLFLYRSLGWEDLDDELDEEDLDKLLGYLTSLLDRRDHAVDSFLGRFLPDPAKLEDTTLTDRTAAYAAGLDAAGKKGRDRLSAELLAGRELILDTIARMSLSQRLPSHADDMARLVDALVERDPADKAKLRSLSWEIQYTDFICVSLEALQVEPILTRLPELVDAGLPDRQRQAFFDMLVRWQDTLDGLAEVVDVVGDSAQRADVQRLLEVRRAFIDNFPANSPTPGVIQTIAAALGVLADDLSGLRAQIPHVLEDIGDEARSIINSLFNDMTDNEAIKVVDALATKGSLLPALPFDVRNELRELIQDGAVEDDEEQAILTLLGERHLSGDRREEALADFLQMVTSAGWEDLDEDFGDTESDMLYKLFDF